MPPWLEKAHATWTRYSSFEQWIAINLAWVGISNFVAKLLLPLISNDYIAWGFVQCLAVTTFMLNVFTGKAKSTYSSAAIFYVSAMLVILGAMIMRLHSPLDTILHIGTIVHALQRMVEVVWDL